MPTTAAGCTAARTRARAAASSRARGESGARAVRSRDLGEWQSRRLRMTYADLEQTPRYAAAMKFFETDLYGGADFAQRDADLARVVPAMKRLLPDHVIATVAVAVELNALSQDLDRAMVDDVALTRPGFHRRRLLRGVSERRSIRRSGERQIRLIGEVGVALDRFVRKPMMRGALTLMRKPARLAGLVDAAGFSRAWILRRSRRWTARRFPGDDPGPRNRDPRGDRRGERRAVSRSDAPYRDP